MTRLALALFALLFAASAQAQNLVTLPPGPKTEAWWLRAQFHALGTQVRGIPVKAIDPGWCRASEFTPEAFPPGTLVEDGYDYFRQTGLSFSAEGSFDGSGTKQTALVGVYETCTKKKGRFLLVIDSGTRKLRFLDAGAGEPHFSVVGAQGRALRVFYCFECGTGATVRWDRARKRFTMR